MQAHVRIYQSDAVFLGQGSLVRDGAIVVDEHDTVRDVGVASEVIPRHGGVPVERLPGLITPALVNAHTHLELSALRGKTRGGHGFFPWAQGMLEARAQLSDEENTAAVEGAVRELTASGTVAIGDVSNSLRAVHACARARIGGIVFHEVFGYDFVRCSQRLQQLHHERDEIVGAWPNGDLRYAPAPHALYSLHPELIKAVVRAARNQGVRTSIHLSEHAGEQEFLENGTGPVAQFAEFLGTELGDFPIPNQRPVPYARTLDLVGSDVIGVHLTTANRQEFDAIAAAHMPIVLCPRSNLFIELRLPPLLDALAAGIRPALGTDSLASNHSLDVLAEARALAERFPSVPSTALWSMVTAWGADALDRPDLGRLAAGTRPGLLWFQGDITTAESDPLRTFLKSSPAQRKKIAAKGVAVMGPTLMATLRDYTSLVAFSHTIFALPFAATAVVLSLLQPRLPLTMGRVGAMVFCLVTARTAAMAFNRYLDREIDAKNPRTQTREIPAGAISAAAALTLTRVCCVLFVASAASLGWVSGLLSIPVLAILLGYSWTKRFTWAAHWVLGAALALAPGGAWIAMGAAPQAAIIALMLAVLTWVAGFDILYSLQDEDFDRNEGLRSVPARFGTLKAVWISRVMHVMTVLAWLSTGWFTQRHGAYFLGVGLATALLVYEHTLVGNGNLHQINRAFFTVNGYVSLLFFLLTALDVYLSLGTLIAS